MQSELGHAKSVYSRPGLSVLARGRVRRVRPPRVANPLAKVRDRERLVGLGRVALLVCEAVAIQWTLASQMEGPVRHETRPRIANERKRESGVVEGEFRRLDD